LNKETYLFCTPNMEVRINMEEMDKRIMEVARNAVKEYLENLMNTDHNVDLFILNSFLLSGSIDIILSLIHNICDALTIKD